MGTKIAVIRHVHPANHHALSTKASLCDIAQRYPQADLVGVEEHGEFARPAPADFASRCPAHAQILTGAEAFAAIGRVGWRGTVTHHVGVIGPNATEGRMVAQGAAVPTMVASAHLAGGAAILNHPEWPYCERHPKTALSYTIPLSDARAFDAVEIFNDRGVTAHGNDPDAVLDWAERNFFTRGIAVAVVSGADDHANTERATSPSYTLAMGDGEGSLQAQVVRAFRSHATYVSKEPAVDLLAYDIDRSVALGRDGEALPASVHSAHLSLDNLPVGGRAVVVFDGKEVSSDRYGGTTWASHLDFSMPSDRNTAYVYAKIYDSAGHLSVVTSPLWLKCSP